MKALTAEDISQVLDQAMKDTSRGFGGQNIELPEETRRMLSELVGGDARRALNSLEMMADMAEIDAKGIRVLTPSLLKEVSGERSARFDNKGDRYYDLISALHKSVRGSAPDAALYWYARIITAGGDPLYVARRLLAIASEDVGNADPRGMQVAIAAWDCFTRVGPAEGERAIAQAIVYLACAPKSNAVYTAFKAAMRDAREMADYDVPEHLRNAPTKLMKEMGLARSIATRTTNPMLMPPARTISLLKWPRPVTTIRPHAGWRAKSVKSWHGWLSRIKIARQNATASVAVAVRLPGITLSLCGLYSAV
ncbi:Replication-associated recombination protein A [Serratia plymuthica]|uniref:Replication-associated recombination protein A n=1 Tax=Serratia plymuthica TaxID=82996 RepID=A0A2X4XI77_SERPL|nr:Replication-associated recombination protein A [Serratia plymuthica]